MKVQIGLASLANHTLAECIVTSTDHFDCYLRLEEVDVFGEVEGVLSTVSNHVSVENIIGSLEDPGQVGLIWSPLQRKLQHPHEQVDQLAEINQITIDQWLF